MQIHVPGNQYAYHAKNEVSGAAWPHNVRNQTEGITFPPREGLKMRINPMKLNCGIPNSFHKNIQYYEQAHPSGSLGRLVGVSLGKNVV